MTAFQTIPNEASLITTFYGPRERIPFLRDYLINAFELEYWVTGTWQAKDKKIFLTENYPQLAQDAMSVQIALNAKGDTATAWKLMRQQLEKALGTAELKANYKPKGEEKSLFWGYTLVYQSVLIENADETKALAEVLEAAQLLFVPKETLSLRPIRKATVAGGWLWLLKIPREKEDLSAMTIYVALAKHNENDQLVEEVLLGDGASLFMPDLIAHKSYFLMRQYRLGGWTKEYNQKIDGLSDDTSLVLQSSETDSKTKIALQQLPEKYKQVSVKLLWLHKRRISLNQQLENYAIWLDQADDKSILAFHNQHLKMALQEIALLIDKGESVLRAAGTTIEITQARQERDFETTVNVLAIGLAIVQVLLAFAGMKMFEGEIGLALTCFSLFLVLTGMTWPIWRKWHK